MATTQSSIFKLLLSFSLIIFASFFLVTPTGTPTSSHHQNNRRQRRRKPSDRGKLDKPNSPSSWELFKNLFTCKQIIPSSQVHDPAMAAGNQTKHYPPPLYSGMTPCSSICSLKDAIAQANTRIVRRPQSSPENIISGKDAAATPLLPVSRATSGVQLRKFSGCYECRMVDPSRIPVPRSSVCPCPDCGQLFFKPEALDHHQAHRHAVSELGQDDSGRNIVEIIFQTSWLKRDAPFCRIERILKVRNTLKTINRFESYRESVKSRSISHTGRKNPRIAADGNELLRFYCTNLNCSIGAGGSTSICSALPSCGVCSVLRNGFSGRMAGTFGLCTTASSGRAHDRMVAEAEERADSKGIRAMILCRVIAGRIRRQMAVGLGMETDQGQETGGDSYDSVAGEGEAYTNLDELYVFSSRAILPCFIVIFKVAL